MLTALFVTLGQVTVIVSLEVSAVVTSAEKTNVLIVGEVVVYATSASEL
jgi:hypothetical protein